MLQADQFIKTGSADVCIASTVRKRIGTIKEGFVRCQYKEPLFKRSVGK